MSAPAFDLAVQGIAAWSDRVLGYEQKPIARDPLIGLVNGTNRLFYTNWHPILSSGSLAVYDGLTSLAGSANYDTGEVTLDTAPNAQPLASYTYSPYTGYQMLAQVWQGFLEMEVRVPRGYKLVDGSGNAATMQSAAIYVADADGVDPVIGSGTFTTSLAQINLLMACADYAYQLARLGASARGDHLVRETSRGMTVDKSRRPANLALALEKLDQAVQRAVEAAEIEAGLATYGGFVPNPVTLDYAANWNWQTASKRDDHRAEMGYHYPLRRF